MFFFFRDVCIIRGAERSCRARGSYSKHYTRSFFRKSQSKDAHEDMASNSGVSGRFVSVVLYRSPGKDWNVEEETKGWGSGGSPGLPSYDNDWDDDISDA